MRRKLVLPIILIGVVGIVIYLFSNSNRAHDIDAALRVQKICLAQNKYLKTNGKYGCWISILPCPDFQRNNLCFSESMLNCQTRCVPSGLLSSTPHSSSGFLNVGQGEFELVHPPKINIDTNMMILNSFIFISFASTYKITTIEW